MIRSYLSGIRNDHKIQEVSKIHLTMAIKSISSKGSDETRIMHSKSNNIEIMIGNDTNEITEELLKALLQRYQERLEESIKESDFFYSVDILYCNLNKVSLNGGG